MARKFSELTDKMSPESRAKAAAKTRELQAEMPLQELRRAKEFTQTTIAQAMGIAQGDVSKIEKRTDVYVSTLRNYIEAMGGELEIRAKFPDGDVAITSFVDLKTGTDG